MTNLYYLFDIYYRKKVLLNNDLINYLKYVSLKLMKFTVLSLMQ